MYPYMYPMIGPALLCRFCTVANSPMVQWTVPANMKSMMRGEEVEEERVDKGCAAPSIPPDYQMMPGMMDMSKMDMEKIKSKTQEIVRMFEMQHPDILRNLIDRGIPQGQARQYISRIVEMTLMHHMMHQM